MKSFLPYSADCEFPIENLPYGVFSTRANAVHRIGVAISNMVLDLSEISQYFTGPELQKNQHVFKETTLNSFMALGPLAWKEARATLQDLLSKENRTIQYFQELRRRAFVPQSEAIMHVPVKIGDFTTFCSYNGHTNNFQQMYQPNQMFPTWRSIPIARPTRTSSIVISGTRIHRPRGITLEGVPPKFGPSEKMDFEAEMGYFIGKKSKMGEPIPIEEAVDYIFGFVLVNSWTPRDIQRFECLPIGPFASKNMGTTISPWVVSPMALEPFRIPSTVQDPQLVSYLYDPENYNYDIRIRVDIIPSGCAVPTTISRSNYGLIYWTPKQHIAHHTITGCNLNVGDLISTGPMSGVVREPSTACSMLELTYDGQMLLILFDGSQRQYLQDGDTVSIRAVSKGKGFNIGFGRCNGLLEPAR